MYTLKEINPARLNNPDAGEKTIFLDQTDSAVKTKNENGLIETLAVVDDNAAPIPLVYKAFLSQSGTSNPTIVVVANTLGAAVVWTRSSTGAYTGTLAGAFPAAKTIGPNLGVNKIQAIGTIEASITKSFNLFRSSDNTLIINVVDVGNELIDLNGTATIPIFIEVYP